LLLQHGWLAALKEQQQQQQQQHTWPEFHGAGL